MQQLRIIFSKSHGARFLSHLDLMATFEYAVRRAGLPVKFSEGFNPRPRLSLAAPLPVGYVGEQEILELSLREVMALDDVRERLQAALPPGLLIRTVAVMEPGERSAAARLQSATYRVDLTETVADLPQRIAALLAEPALHVREQRAEWTTRERDVRGFLLQLAGSDGITIRMTAALGPAGTVRPEQLLLFLGINPDGAAITRECLNLAAPPSRPGSQDPAPHLP